MKTVYTKDELKTALKAKEEHIIVQGELAKQIERRAKLKKRGVIAGVGLVVVGAALIPFTGGASAPIIGTGFTTTVGSVTITMTAAELAMILGAGTAISMTAILKGYNINIGDNKVELKKKDKQDD